MTHGPGTCYGPNLAERRRAGIGLRRPLGGLSLSVAAADGRALCLVVSVARPGSFRFRWLWFFLSDDFHRANERRCSGMRTEHMRRCAPV
jgi:hypothetical protein